MERVGCCHVPVFASYLWSGGGTELRASARSYKRFGPLFLAFVRMMVSLGLAGAHVQPYPRNNIELRATSCELRANSNFGLLEARGSLLEARD